MKVLITGSNGYVGNFLSEYLSSKGIHVIGLDLASDARQRKYQYFIFEQCDVRDAYRIKQIFAKHRPTHVIHLAYLMNPQHNRKFEDDVDINGSINVFLAAQGIVKQFIHFSSASVYGGWPDNPLFMTEQHPVKPRDWVYAKNKKTVEEFYISCKKDFKLINFRMCTAVGPSYYKKGGVVATLAKSPLGLFLDSKDTELQFIHEDDVKKIVELMLNDNDVEGIFNLAPDSFAATKQLNPNKYFFSAPKWLFKTVIALLWHLRISLVSPTSVNLIAHGIVVSSEKLMERYKYQFLYSTKSAYEHAVNERKKNGTL